MRSLSEAEQVSQAAYVRPALWHCFLTLHTAAGHESGTLTASYEELGGLVAAPARSMVAKLFELEQAGLLEVNPIGPDHVRVLIV